MSDKQPLPAAELMALLEADRQRRVQAVQAAIQAALTEHGCDLVAVVVPIIAPDFKVEMRARIDIVPR